MFCIYKINAYLCNTKIQVKPLNTISKMKTIYQVRRENISLYTGNTIEIVFETTRKREAESWINSIYKTYKKYGMNPMWVREGYFQLLDDQVEYFICKA